MADDAVKQIPALVQKLYGIVAELEASFPGRKFTPDGHLVGSIGEVLAAHIYDLKLLTASEPTHDAQSADGRYVQIKATQARSVGLRSKPDYLLVLKLMPDGTTTEVFNGPGDLPWNAAGKMQSNGQRSIGLNRLSELMVKIPEHQRLKRVKI